MHSFQEPAETQPDLDWAADRGMTVDGLVKSQANHLVMQR